MSAFGDTITGQYLDQFPTTWQARAQPAERRPTPPPSRIIRDGFTWIEMAVFAVNAVIYGYIIARWTLGA